MISGISLNNTIGDKLANNAARIAVLSLILSLVTMYLSYSAFTGLGLGFGKSLPISYTLGAASLLFIADAIRYARMHLDEKNIPQNIPPEETRSSILQTTCGISRPLVDLIEGYAPPTEYLVAFHFYSRIDGCIVETNNYGIITSFVQEIWGTKFLKINQITFAPGHTVETVTNLGGIVKDPTSIQFDSTPTELPERRLNLYAYSLKQGWYIRLVKVYEKGIFRLPHAGEVIDLNNLENSQ